METGNIEGVELFDIASHFLSKRNSEQENPKKVLKITKKTRSRSCASTYGGSGSHTEGSG